MSSARSAILPGTLAVAASVVALAQSPTPFGIPTPAGRPRRKES